MKKNKAFSLVELLISIIIISLITAAFAPVITKKVKANLLLVNGGGTNIPIPDNNPDSGGDVPPPNNDDEEPEYLDPACVDGPNETCCNNLNAIYISSATHKGYTGKPICMTKFNVGDQMFGSMGTYYNPKYATFGVQMLYPYLKNSHDAKCVMTEENKNTCCWKGTTSTNKATTGNNVNKTNPDNYGGSDRTVCQQEAAQLLCENWARGGSYKYSWRLPTSSEMDAIAAYIKNDTKTENPSTHKNLSKWAGSGGLQLCDNHTNVSAAKQAAYQSSNYCPTNTSVCQGAASNYCYPAYIWTDTKPYRLNNGTLAAQTNTNKMTAGVRCVTEHPGVRLKEKNDYAATGTEPKNQDDCDKYGALFISKKYTGNKNLCMLQYSVEPPSEGGKYEFDYADSGVSLLQGGQKCALTDATCCWTGATGTAGGTQNYPGSSRAVCQYEAARRLCENYKPSDGVEKTGKWRLPSADELGNIALYLMASSEYSPFLSKYLDAGSTGGIQLCDSASYLFGSNTCKTLAKCSGASDESRCKPWGIWTSTPNSTDKHYIYQLSSGVFKKTYLANKSALSVRCVTDSLEGDVDKYTPGANEPKSQEDCDPFGAIFLEHKYTKGKNLCMTGYNLNDYRSEDYKVDFHSAKVTLVPGKQRCNSASTGMCCWEGGNNPGGNGWITNPNHKNAAEKGGSYSGSTRTLCQRKAALAMCENWKPISSSDGKVYANWRLPTQIELNNLIPAFSSGGASSPGPVKYSGDSGLQFCDASSEQFGVHKCSRAAGYMVGASACAQYTSEDSTTNYYSCPYRIWSSGFPFDFTNGTFKLPTSFNGENTAAGVRCVTDTLIGTTPAIKEEKECSVNEIFIPKKYTGTSNLCMKQYNFGDDPDLDDYYTLFSSETVKNNFNARGVNLTPSNTTCTDAADGLCCWYGSTITTGTTYDSSTYPGSFTSSYTPGGRTLCQYTAATKLCSAYGAGWRLLKDGEMSNLVIALNAEGQKSVSLSRYMGNRGLDFCDGSATKGIFGSSYCALSQRCKGAKSNYCYSHLVWNQRSSTANTGYEFKSGIFIPYTISETKSVAGSVRCVKEIY